jgi:CRISPR-associated protein Cas1
VGICLPDEVNVLTARQGCPPRRLMAADHDAVPLHATEPGSVVGIDGGRRAAMCALFEREADVFHLTHCGWLLGLSKNVMLRIRQTTVAAHGQLDDPRRMIAGKIRNCRVLLRRNGGMSWRGL